MSKYLTSDSRFALEQDLNGITQNAVFPEYLNELNYRPRTLIDETLETIDPTPDVHGMFMQFNQLFFWGKLDTVYVKWSPRMTTCAGICTFIPRNRECIIALSAPLLKLRPRKDLVETLLHEMIHGYLFVTNNNRDRDGHGPEFCKHMNRINRAAGTNITIYHSFHDEVRLYQQHWWKCDGPCKNRPPYFGTVRRAMNRAPGPSDFWWAAHQTTCGGKFIKIREPEKPKARSKSSSNTKADSTNSTNSTNTSKPKQTVKPLPNQNTLDRFIITNNKGDCPCSPRTPVIPSGLAGRLPFVNGTTNHNPSAGLKKLGNSTNNVYGFGTGGPGSQPTVNKPPSKPSGNQINFTGTVGGKDIGKSRLLDLYSPSRPTDGKVPANMNDNNRDGESSFPKCPICDEIVFGDINSHIDRCLNQETTPKRPRIEKPNENLQECPMCGDLFSPDQINVHIELCLPDGCDGSDILRGNGVSMESTRREPMNPQRETTLPRCPICNKFFAEDIINDHVDVCLFEQQASGDDLRSQPNDTPNHSNLASAGRAQLLDIIDLTESPRPRGSNITNCFTCNKDIQNSDYYDHVQECLAKLRSKEYQSDEVIEIKDDVASGSSRRQASASHYKCLVCSEMVSNRIPLEEHLEVCVQVPFSNSNESFEEIDEGSEFLDATMQPLDNKKQLCPICMKLISERLIAAHVNQCDKFKI